MSGYTGAAQAAGNKQAVQGGKYFAGAADFFRGNPCHPYPHTAFGTHATFDWLVSAGKCAPDTVGRTGLSGVFAKQMQLCNPAGSLEPRLFCKKL